MNTFKKAASILILALATVGAAQAQDHPAGDVINPDLEDLTALDMTTVPARESATPVLLLKCATGEHVALMPLLLPAVQVAREAPRK